jgi:hypothetical protein
VVPLICIYLIRIIAKRSINTKIANGFIPSHKNGLLIISIILFKRVPGYCYSIISIINIVKANANPEIPTVTKAKLTLHSFLLYGITRLIGILTNIEKIA